MCVCDQNSEIDQLSEQTVDKWTNKPMFNPMARQKKLKNEAKLFEAIRAKQEKQKIYY